MTYLRLLVHKVIYESDTFAFIDNSPSGFRFNIRWICFSIRMWTKSNQTKIAAYIVLIISSIGAGISYITGEAAEEAVEEIQGVAKEMIEQHEEFSLYALIALIVLGVVSLIGLLLTWRKSSLIRTVALVTLFISLISFGLVA